MQIRSIISSESNKGEFMGSKCVISSIRNISGMVEKFIVQEVKKMDYPISKNHILLFYLLPGQGQMMVFNVLCSKWGISKSSLSDIVNKYVDLGLVEKHECRDDKRVTFIQLTPEGDTLRNKLIDIEEDFKKKIYKGLDVDEQKTFESLVSQVEDNINL